MHDLAIICFTVDVVGKMTTVGIPLSVGQLAVYMMLIGFDNMDQIQAFGASSGLCAKANYTTAENDCKNRSKGIMNISDFATPEFGRQLLVVVARFKEIWIEDEGGVCQTYIGERGTTNGNTLSSTNTDTTYKFQNASCDDLHYYVCKRSASNPKNDSSFLFDVTCPEERRPTPHPSSTSGFTSPLLMSMVCIFFVLVIGIIAVYPIVKREKNGKTNGTPSQAGEARYMRSNPADSRESGLHTEGNEAANRDSLTSGQAQGPLGAEDEDVDVVVVRCEDPRETDDLDDNPLYVTY